MKKLTTYLLLLATSFTYAQNIGINSTGSIPDASAMLDIDATEISQNSFSNPINRTTYH